MSTKNTIDIVFFHYPCQDGLSASWVAHKYKTENKLDFAIIGIDHKESKDSKNLFPVDIKNKNLLFLDIAPNNERYDFVKKEAKSFLIIDHHITNKNLFDKDSSHIFDMKKSGCHLAWNYFYPNIETPKFLLMIEDRDIWKWEFPESKDFTSGLYNILIGLNFDECYQVFYQLYNKKNKVDEIINFGKIFQKKQSALVHGIAKTSSNKAYSFRGKKVCMVNVSGDLTSELGNELVSKYDFDFAILWRYDHIKEEYWISMRSTGDVYDVSLLCKEFGGGGHKNAAGCTVKKHPVEVFCDSK